MGEKQFVLTAITRQPILDRECRTFGYELLFRSGLENSFCGDGELASRTVIDDVLVYGVDSLVGDYAPFIHCTHANLADDVVSLLPKHAVLSHSRAACWRRLSAQTTDIAS